MAEQEGGSLVGKVADLLFGVIKTEIGYMWNCTQNVEKFKNEVEKLRDMKGRIQQQIDVANTVGDHLKHGVEKWVHDADQEISKAEVFLQQEASAKKTVIGNWATLHHYGKKTVTEKTPSLLEHQASGTPYEGGVSIYTPAPGPLDAYQKKNLENLDTHNLALKAIIAALEDESKQIIGIYGLGGVGKTTLVKEVVARVKNNLFADVAFATVSQSVKVEEIKKDLENATKRIKKGDKILIILDDVWEKLNLEDDLCIPCGSDHMNCKILLTSRSEQVCQHMNAHSKICVNFLPIKEAWILFKRVVGERLETEACLKTVALKVVEECGGLPLLIQAVGNALKDKSIKSWESALTQLKNHAPLDIDQEIRKSFTHLKLSYDYLKSEEAKSCFLLCSLFPEDDDISLEKLVLYGVGLGKFVDLDSIEDARGRVHNAVNILTSSGLLLNTQREGSTKMHDVVRDVALLIASEGQNKYLVKAGKDLTKWLPRNNNLESYTGISLMYNDIIKLPDYTVNIPNLEIFLVNSNRYLSMISDEFIGCMKEVKVLDMGCCQIKDLPQSLKLLTKLCMLNLQGNEYFHDISILGEMKELEILILNKTGIRKIPQEIGQLVKLRRLELIGCKDMTRVTPGVISELKRLEVLCIDFRDVREGVYACIVEVMKLSKLTCLDLIVNSFDLIPEGFNLENLKGFFIQIGETYKFHPSSNSKGYLQIRNQYLVIPLVKWLKKLIEVSRPHIVLYKIENLNNIIPTMYDEGFNKLEHIELIDCSNVSCLVNDGTRCDWDEGRTSEKYFMELKTLRLGNLNKLKAIWKCPDEYISLTNLVSLSINNCHKLERVFTVSVARGLVHLKDLTIGYCDGLEEVIWVEQQHYSSSAANKNTSIIIVFPSLAKISLYELPGLKSFFNSAAGNGTCSIIIKYPSLVDVSVIVCRSMKKWGLGIHETPNLKTLVVNTHVPIVVDGPFAINEAVEKSWRK